MLGYLSFMAMRLEFVSQGGMLAWCLDRHAMDDNVHDLMH